MAMKRANGTGSVYKMKHKALRKPYRAVVTLGYNSDGKPLRKSIGTFATQKEAYNALSAYDANAPQYETKDTTFGQCWEWMIEDKMRKGVQLDKGGYPHNKKKMLHLMNIPIKNIRLTHLQAIIDDHSHMSGPALAQIKTAMNGCFLAAIRNDIVDKNYASLVTLPAKEKSTLHKPFLPAEIYDLWQLSNTDEYARIMLCLIYTGMRPGEIKSIKFADVHIMERYMIGGIKTDASKNRIIPIADCIMPFIRKWYNTSRFEHGEYMLPTSTPKNIQMALSRYLKMKVPGHLPHDGRHTFATLLTQIGTSDAMTKTLMGHSHKDVTNQVYIHRDVDELISVVNQIPHGEAILSVKDVIKRHEG